MAVSTQLSVFRVSLEEPAHPVHLVAIFALTEGCWFSLFVDEV